MTRAIREARNNRHDREGQPRRGPWVFVLSLVVVLMACAGTVVAQVSISDAPPKKGGAPLPFPQLPPPKEADPKTFPRAPDGKPDFSGIWHPGLDAVLGDNEPLKAEPAAKSREWQAASSAGKPMATPVSRCEAFGMPSVMNMDALEFIYLPRKQLTVISEILHEVRRVYMDGRAHPTDFEPGFDGHSIGHWQGDTLVVETVGLLPSEGPPWLTRKARIVERLRMVNPDAILNEITVSDPDVLTSDWKYSRTYRRGEKNEEIPEYVCTNNRNLPDATGAQTAR